MPKLKSQNERVASARARRQRGRARALSAYDPFYAVRAYELAREGKSDSEIAGALKVPVQRFEAWVSTHPPLRKALTRGRWRLDRDRKAPASTKPFFDYVAGRLPADLKAKWDELNAIESEPNSEKRLEWFFADCGIRVRQWLFLHALMACNFNKTAACAKVGVSVKVLRQWIETDPEFAELATREMLEAKKDFVEGCHLALIARGDSPATIAASKSLNADRGYAVKKEVRNFGGPQSVQNVTLNVSIEDLDALSPDQKAALLDAIEARTKPKDVTHTPLPQGD